MPSKVLSASDKPLAGRVTPSHSRSLSASISAKNIVYPPTSTTTKESQLDSNSIRDSKEFVLLMEDACSILDRDTVKKVNLTILLNVGLLVRRKTVIFSIQFSIQVQPDFRVLVPFQVYTGGPVPFLFSCLHHPRTQINLSNLPSRDRHSSLACRRNEALLTKTVHLEWCTTDSSHPKFNWNCVLIWITSKIQVIPVSRWPLLWFLHVVYYVNKSCLRFLNKMKQFHASV